MRGARLTAKPATSFRTDSPFFPATENGTAVRAGWEG